MRTDFLCDGKWKTEGLKKHCHSPRSDNEARHTNVQNPQLSPRTNHIGLLFLSVRATTSRRSTSTTVSTIPRQEPITAEDFFVSRCFVQRLKTEDLTVRTTDAHFSRVSAHVTVAQDFLPTRVMLAVHDEFVCLSPHFSKVSLSSHVSSQLAWSS